MSVDLMTIKPGMKISTKDGATLIVRGSYMSSDGLVFTARKDERSKVERNVLASDIVAVSV